MQSITARRLEMEEASPYKIVPKMSVPTIVAMLVDSIYNLADTFFVSSLGENATAAVAVNDSLMMVILAVGAGFGFGAASYMSRLLGAHDDDHASQVASSTFVCGLATSFAALLIIWPLRQKLVMLLGSTAESAAYSVDYATWIILALPFTVGINILSQTLKSEGNTRLSMIGTTSGCVLNCILDPIFINVLGLEVAGAAAATALSKIVSFAVLAVPFIRKKTLIEISPKKININRNDVKEVLKIGIPSFLKASLISFGGIVLNRAAKLYGTSVLAGISVANKLYKLIASAIIGFAQGFAPIVGYCYGAKKYKRVKELYYATCLMGIGACIVLSVFIWFGAPSLVSIFNKSSSELASEISIFKLHVLCIGFVPHMFNIITNHLYQALGKPIGNTLLSLSRQLIVLIPAVKILSNLYGAKGVAAAQGVSDIISGIFIALPAGIIIVKSIAKEAGNEAK